MKLQDIVFFIFLAVLIWKHNPKYFVLSGLAMLVVAIPLFAKWIFFTAERLTWYAALCMLIAVILLLLEKKRES